MGYDIQFVDSIAAVPTVRLDLMAAPWTVRESTEFGMPELRRSAVSTLLTDGDQYPAAAYGNRMLSLVLRVDAATDDAAAAALQLLYRELDRPTNLLRYRPGTTAPVFFRTFRAGADAVQWDPVAKEVRAQIPAEPFALGLKETLPQVTVYNDPAEGTTLNANPNFESEGVVVEGGFEVNLTGWVGINGTAVRSTAQAHAGVASALVTPSGSGVVARVEADMSLAAPAVPGQTFTADAWVRPTTASKPAAVQITWRDSGGAFLSSSVLTAAAAAGVWQFLSVTGVAPAGAAFAQPAAGVGSTPTAVDTAHVDELRLMTVPSWMAAGCTIDRSTAQFHQGVASLLVTPDGVTATATARSEMVPATAGVTYRASEWVRCAVARNVAVNINWYTSASVFISSTFSTVAVAANTWTLLDWADVAPPGTGKAQVTVFMTGTPPAGNTLHVDEARLRQAGGDGGGCFDVASPKGDVETPLHMRFAAGSVTAFQRQSVIAVRRRGTPSAAPFVLQAESSPGGTDTALGAANDTAFSGSGQNYVRTTFATDTSMVQRFSITTWPAAASVDVRGQYRVFARVRKSVASATIAVRMSYGNNSGVTFDNDSVTLRASSTDVHYADLGVLQFPIGSDPVTDGMSGVEIPVRGLFLAVYAQRVSGTGNLDLDALVFVPADDRLMLLTWQPDAAATAHIIDSARAMVYAVGSAGEVQTISAPAVAGSPPMVSPGVANRITFLQDTGSKSFGGDVLTNTTTITPYYWPRYLYVRPVAS